MRRRHPTLWTLLVFLFVLVETATWVRCASAEPLRGESVAEARVAGALFTPTRTDDGIVWHALWVLTPESATDISSGAVLMLRLAVPLPDGEVAEMSPGVAPAVEHGRVVGLFVDREAASGRIVSAVVRHRTSLDGRVHHGAPVAAGSSLQIIDGDLGAGTRLEIEPGRVLEQGVGHMAPPGTSHAAREEARRLTGYTARVTGAAVYVRGDDVRAEGGLMAAVSTPRARGHRGSIAIGVVFGAIVLALLAAVRKLRHSAGVERADALLASELDALDVGRR